MGDLDETRLLSSIDERQDRQGTAWGEVRTVGAELQESSTTTLPPNSRFGFVRNGNYLNPDTVDTDVDHNQPVYSIPLTADDTWVAGGTDRNAYVPGFESQGGIGFQLSEAPASEGDLLPPSVDVLEAGYATLLDQALSGVPNEDFAYGREGFALHIERGGPADIRVYKNGTVATSLARSDWETDPFSDPRFDWDPSRFIVLRVRFDLYGGGNATLLLRIRDTDGQAHLVELGTIGLRDDPLLRIYNHPMQLRVQAAGQVSGSPTADLAALEFHNNFSGTPPKRTKSPPYRDVDVNDSTGADTWTVVRVYRMDITRREAATFTRRLYVAEASTDTTTMLRSVHRDFLTFPDTFDQDDDANWIAPGTAQVRETSLEEANLASDQVTIDTFTDDDDETKVRGEKEIIAPLTAGAGNRTATRDREGESPLSEHDYLCLLAQVGSTAENINLIEPTFEERW